MRIEHGNAVELTFSWRRDTTWQWPQPDKYSTASCSMFVVAKLKSAKYTTYTYYVCWKRSWHLQRRTYGYSIQYAQQ